MLALKLSHLTQAAEDEEDSFYTLEPGIILITCAMIGDSQGLSDIAMLIN